MRCLDKGFKLSKIINPIQITTFAGKAGLSLRLSKIINPIQITTGEWCEADLTQLSKIINPIQITTNNKEQSFES